MPVGVREESPDVRHHLHCGSCLQHGYRVQRVIRIYIYIQPYYTEVQDYWSSLN